MKKITLIALMLFTALGYSQVGINTNNPDASSALEIESTTGGILIPRLTETQRDDISAPATGLMIYQTNGTSGFYFWDGAAWTKIDGVAGPQGIQGFAGAAGLDGTDGNDGVQGIQGVAGAAGINGTDGADGTNGSDGIDGTNGSDGIDGAQGLTGSQGETGVAGPQGEIGVDGAQGAQGVSGPQGETGVAGPQGEIGVTGSQGETGVAGPQGEIGVAGPQGEDGPWGYDGNSGKWKLKLVDDAEQISGGFTIYSRTSNDNDYPPASLLPAGYPVNVPMIYKKLGAILRINITSYDNFQFGELTNASTEQSSTIQWSNSFNGPNNVGPGKMRGWFNELYRWDYITVRSYGDPLDYVVYKIQHPSDPETENINDIPLSLYESAPLFWKNSSPTGSSNAFIEIPVKPISYGDTNSDTFDDGDLYIISYTRRGLRGPSGLIHSVIDRVDGADETPYTQPTYLNNTFYAELGGYVIEVNSDGTHGLVVAMQDQGTSNWYEADDLLSNASNHDINGAKFKDWRLPTKRELNLMYVVYSDGNGANLNSGVYWSSTEVDAINAWLQDFSDGFQYNYNKYNAFNVRAVRAF